MRISLFSILQVLTVNLKILWGNTFLSSLFPLDLADDRKKESDRWKGGESFYFWIALSHLLWVSNKKYLQNQREGNSGHTYIPKENETRVRDLITHQTEMQFCTALTEDEVS